MRLRLTGAVLAVMLVFDDPSDASAVAHLARTLHHGTVAGRFIGGVCIAWALGTLLWMWIKSLFKRRR